MTDCAGVKFTGQARSAPTTAMRSPARSARRWCFRRRTRATSTRRPSPVPHVAVVRGVRGQGGGRHRSGLAVRHGRARRRANRCGRRHRRRRAAHPHAARHPHEPHAHPARRRCRAGAAGRDPRTRARASSTAASATASRRAAASLSLETKHGRFLRAVRGSRSTAARCSRADALRLFPAIFEEFDRDRPGSINRPLGAVGASVHVRRSRPRATRRRPRSTSCTRTPRASSTGRWPTRSSTATRGGASRATSSCTTCSVRPPPTSRCGATRSTSTSRQGVKFHMRMPDEPLRWMLADPRRLEMKVEDQLWLRVLDVPGALAARTYGPSRAGSCSTSPTRSSAVAGRFELDAAESGAGHVQAEPPGRRRRDDDRRPRRRVPRRRSASPRWPRLGASSSAAPAPWPAPTSSSRTTPSPGAAPSSDRPPECSRSGGEIVPPA